MTVAQEEAPVTHLAWIRTPRCIVCGEYDEFIVGEAQLQHYKTGAFVQDAFPQLSASRREQIMTGTHDACWDKMFKEDN